MILKYLRLTFGDAIAANVIEQIMIYFVTQKTENELTKMFLKFYRFVDDFAMGHASKELLFQGAVDLQKSLNSLDFHLKRILSNQSWHLKENVTHLGPQWSIPAFPGEIEQLFGHLWSHYEDTIQPKTQLFVGKKTRGAFKGVQFCEVDTFIITKRLLSSLIGQCFSLDGTFLSPIRCALKILFHQVCSLTQEWNLNVSDTKVGKLCQQFLQLLKKRINDLKSHQRLIIKPDFTPTKLESFGDGSQFCASFCSYIIAKNSEEVSDSNICQAVCRLKNHSIPCNEMLGFVQATENPVNYFITHYNVLKTVKHLNIATDSKCLLYSLSPYKQHTSVLIRNGIRKCLSLAKNLTKRFDIQVNFYYCPSEMNPSDLNSKIPANLDVIEICNSEFWRHGPPCILDEDYPKSDDIFMTIKNGYRI